MCLILTGPSDTVRATLLDTHGLVRGIFDRNPDGLGVMYATTKGLKIVKAIPRTLDEAMTVVRNLPRDARNLCMHWRMRTHGAIDSDNTHPYVVVPGRVAMVHNGILDTGNDADESRSDTWHFIQSYLAEPLAKYPELLQEEKFQRLLADFIDSNRFVFMDAEGHMTTINKDQGVEHGGLWFSNTYAWEPGVLIPGYKRAYAPPSRSQDWYNGYELYPTARSFRGAAAPKRTLGEARTVPLNDATREFCECIVHSDSTDAAELLCSYPLSCIDALTSRFTPTLTPAMRKPDAMRSLSEAEAQVVGIISRGDVLGLSREATTRPVTVSDVAAYYFDWTPKAAVPGVNAARADEDGADTPEDAQSSDCFEYEGFEIHVATPDGGASWDYTTLSEDGGGIEDEGYGFPDSKAALEWATSTIDETLLERALDEQEYRPNGREVREALEAIARAQ